MKKNLAGLAWGVAIVTLLGYEFYAVASVPGGTLSEWVWAHAQHPMISFAAGVLVGHFWWQRRK